MLQLVLLTGLLLYACREKYVPKLNDKETGYLVVDGFINAGTGPTTIYLSRTTSLSSAATLKRETGASVYITGGGSTFTLKEVSPGIYQNTQLVLDPATSYQLNVSAGGKLYASAPSAVRRTPDMDSVYWRMESGGVQFYADAHDNSLPVGYYQFRYEDTWEFHSKYTSSLKVFYRNGVPHHIGHRDSSKFSDDLSLWRCWKTDTATRILIASTAKLTRNQVSAFPVVYIEPGSVKLDVRYSINVHMYAISQQAYQFQEQLKKNTELIGSIFDGQPSDNFGNMKCVSDPSIPVIGFVEVTEERSRRLFIDATQLPNWQYFNVCDPEFKLSNSPTWLYGSENYIPTRIADGNIDSAWFAPALCVDCRLKGTNQKPSFW